MFCNSLASLARYFNISNWKSYRKPSIVNWSQSLVYLKLEVENSPLFVPIEQNKEEFLQLGLEKLFLSTIQKAFFLVVMLSSSIVGIENCFLGV
jgi:hypothetical protein